MGSELVVTSDKKQVCGSELVVIYFREKVVNRYSLRSDYLKKAGREYLSDLSRYSETYR